MYEVNRSVIIVIPTELFWNWLQNLPDTDLSELTLEDLQEDANSYLIPACQNADEVWDEVEVAWKKSLRRNWQTGAKTKPNGQICTPIFSANGLKLSFPALLPTSAANHCNANPLKSLSCNP